MVDTFLKYVATERGLSPLTVKSYKIDLRQWEQFMRAADPDGRFLPLDYKATDLRAWIANLSELGLSPATIHRKASSLKAFYGFLLADRKLTDNPADYIALSRLPGRLPVFIRPDEMELLLNTPCDTTDFTALRNRLIMTLLYSTGMRSAELIGLLDVNVDCTRCELKVHGKRNKDRIIPFGNELRDMIEQYRALRNAEVTGPSGSDTLVVLASGRPLYRKALYNIVNSQLRDAGIHASRMSPHVMRHSFASDMLNSGADLHAVSKLLGHKSLASTQVYTHISYRELKQNYLTAHPRAQKKGEKPWK